MSNFHKRKTEEKATIAYKYTNAQIAEIERAAYAAGVQKGVIEGIHCTVGAMCKVLKTSYRFGKGRLPGVCDRVLGMLSHAGGPNVISVDDLKKAAFELGDVKDIEFKRR